jgi:hypothetical protein
VSIARVRAARERARAAVVVALLVPHFLAARSTGSPHTAHAGIAPTLALA